MTPLSAWWISKVATAAIGMVGFVGIGVAVILMTAPQKGLVEKLDTAGLYGTAGTLLAMPFLLVLSLFLQTRLPPRPVVATKPTSRDGERAEPDIPLPLPVPAQGDEDIAINENGTADGTNLEEESGRYSEITSGEEGLPDIRPLAKSDSEHATLYEESPAEFDKHVKVHVPASFLPPRVEKINFRPQSPSYSYYTSPYSGTDQRGSRNQQPRLNASNETRQGVRSVDELSSYSFYSKYPSYQEVNDQDVARSTPPLNHLTAHQDVQDQ